MAEKKRRGHNEGSVYYDESKKRWVAAVSIAPGKRKKFFCKTKQEAIRVRNEALRDLERGTLAIGPQQKLSTYLAYWLEEVHKPTIRLSSYIKYNKLINAYIIPTLGDVQVQKLTPQQVQSLYTKLGKRNLSSKTINSVHGVLHKALDNAVRWNLVSRNVCDLVSPPRIVKRQMKPLTLDQAHKLLEAAKGHRFEVLLMLAVVTGMRRGELLALRWSEIDLDRHILLVSRTVDYIAHHGYVETEPKTHSGKRQIVLPAFMVDMLKVHRAKQEEQRLAIGDKWEGLGVVFCDLHGGYINPRYLLVLFRKLLQEAGLPGMHFHDLRHSAVTLLMSMGVNIKVIQELLGHSDIVITLGTYGHLLPTMQGDAMEKWDDVFGGEQDDSEDSEDDDGEESGGVLAKR
jgi:integrase